MEHAKLGAYMSQGKSTQDEIKSLKAELSPVWAVPPQPRKSKSLPGFAEGSKAQAEERPSKRSKGSAVPQQPKAFAIGERIKMPQPPNTPPPERLIAGLYVCE